MKKIISIFIILTMITSCHHKKEKKESTLIPQKNEPNAESVKLVLNVSLNETLANWVDHYQERASGFNLNQFEFKFVDSLVSIPGSVVGNFDKNFDPIYSDFLVYSPDRKQYLDFDSYQWSLDENKILSFATDQEINLVDIENQSVTRIAFRGPSQWVEDAFWENDSTIVLLENTDEKQPIISKFDLDKKTIKTYMYLDTLNFESKYVELRFQKKGVRYK